jgi:hypothetical protein
VAGEVEFQPTEADYVGANRDWLRRALRTPKARRRWGQFAAIFALAGIAMGYFDGGLLGAAISAFVFPLCYLALCAIACGVAYLLVPGRAGRLYRQQKTMQQPFHYAWTDEGITLCTPSSEGRYGWSQLYCWTSGRTAILIFFNDQLFFFLPCRALGSEGTADLEATLERAAVPPM